MASQQLITNIKANRFITIDQQAASRLPVNQCCCPMEMLFTDAAHVA